MEIIRCKVCVMDGSAPEIKLDENGVCNFCHEAQRELSLLKKNYIPIVLKIMGLGKKKYNCLIGLSGGVDSSTILVKAVELRLKPLCFSVDNGWQDPKAQENIMRLVEGLKIPYYRYTIDLDKFRELQSAFMRAGLINIEIPTDHILMATTYEMASKYGIKYIISGGNVNTESVMPPSWSYTARDLTHIKDVYKKIIGKKLKGLPLCGLWKLNYYWWIKQIKIVYLLDYFNYNRAESEKMLIEKFGFQSTGEKHEESVFTKWYQNFYLFEKFGIDKRKCHYSSLINSGQMTRSEALFNLTASPVYPLLGIESRVMSYPKRRHEDFKQDRWYARISRLIKALS